MFIPISTKRDVGVCQGAVAESKRIHIRWLARRTFDNRQGDEGRKFVIMLGFAPARSVNPGGRKYKPPLW